MANPDLYEQDTEVGLLKTLASVVKRKTFVDVGAERGSVALCLMRMGLRGVLFEPLGKHGAALTQSVAGSDSCFFPYAIDRCDRSADLHLSYDEHGQVRDYFHSLHELPDDARVNHRGKVPVTCRSLQSLVAEGVIEPAVGILKIDTEGNDLNVIRGMGSLEAEVLMCEFAAEGLYAGWEGIRPGRLIEEAEKRGFAHCLAVIRRGASERVSWSPTEFAEGDWGNLVFMNDDVYRKCREEIDAIASERMESAADDFPPIPIDGLSRRITSLHDWLDYQWPRHAGAASGGLLIDVGAYRGEFTGHLLRHTGFEKAVLFEPNPASFDALQSALADDERLVIERLALGSEVGEVEFHVSNDLATGSVLSYAADSLDPSCAVEALRVEQTTLDRYLEERECRQPVGLIKVDTQGYELKVLQGAEKTLARNQPWILVELLFGPLYEGQGSPAHIIDWLSRRGYVVAGFFNEYFSSEGWLTFADALLVPRDVASDLGGPYRAKLELGPLQEELQTLRVACAERLRLIDFLAAESAERARTIQRLRDSLRQGPGVAPERLAEVPDHSHAEPNGRGGSRDSTIMPVENLWTPESEIISEGTPVRLGEGWYQAETSDGETFRWVNNDAKLVVDRPHRLALEVEAGPGLGGVPFVLEVRSEAGGGVQSVLAEGRKTVEVDLAQGVYRLHVESGGRTYPGDWRTLNFRVFDLRSIR